MKAIYIATMIAVIIAGLAATQSIAAVETCDPTELDLVIGRPNGQSAHYGGIVESAGLSLNNCGEGVPAQVQFVVGTTDFWVECEPVVVIGYDMHTCQVTIDDNWPTGVYDVYMIGLSEYFPPAMAKKSAAFKVSISQIESVTVAWATR